MSRNTQLIKNTFILAIGFLAPKFIAFITLPIITSRLTTTEYGIYDLILSIASILIPLLTLQIQQGCFRYLISATEISDKKAYITSTLLYVMCTVGIAFVVILLSLIICRIPVALSCSIGAMLLFEAAYLVLGQILRGMGKNLIYSIGIIVYAVVNMMMILLFIVLLDQGLMGLVIAMTCGYCTSALYMFLQREVRGYLNVHDFSKEHLKEMLAFSAPIVPSTISLWVVNLSDRLIITTFLSVGLNGIYSVANKIPQLFTAAFSIFYMAWTETAARAVDDDDVAEYYSDMFQKLFSFLIGIMLFLITAAPILFDLLIDEKFTEGYNQIPILFIGVFFNSFVAFYGGIYVALKETKKVAFSTIVGAGINITINLTCIRWMGLYAASVATALSYFAIAAYRYYDINKMLKLQYDAWKITTGLALFFAALAACYLKSISSIAFCLLLALGYNWIHNRYLATYFLKKMSKRIYK